LAEPGEDEIKYVEMRLGEKCRIGPNSSKTVWIDTELPPGHPVKDYWFGELRWQELNAVILSDCANRAGQVAVNFSNATARRIVLPIRTLVAEVPVHRDGPLADWEEWQEHLDKAHAGVKSERPFRDRFNVTHLNAEQRERLMEVLEKHQNAFIKDGELAPPTPVMQYEVRVDPKVQPIARPPYRVSHSQEGAYEEEIQKWLDLKVIEEANSPWAAPISMVVKTNAEGKVKRRLVCDFRAQNEVTLRDNFPPPNMESVVNSLHGAKFLSVFDVSNAYLCVEIHPDSRDFFGLVTCRGTYRCVRMMFGARNSGAMYCRLMERVMRGQQNCKWYVDDLLVHSETFEQHLLAISEVLGRLAEAKLLLKAEKAILVKEEVRFLGHLVSGDGVKIDPIKVRAILDFPVPRRVGHVRSYLGMVGFHRKLIKDFGKIAMPLFPLTSGDRKQLVTWTPECQRAFETLKNALTQAPIMALPDWKVGEFVIRADASGRAIGGTLGQVQNGAERVILYYSRKMSAAESKTSVTEQEALAIVEIVRHCSWYLQGYRVICYSDHKPLSFLGKYKSFVNPKMVRWQLFLSGYDIEFRWVKGTSNGLADGLSRAVPDDDQSDDGEGDDAAPPARSAKMCRVAALRGREVRNVYDPIPDHATYAAEQGRDGEFAELHGDLVLGQVESSKFEVRDGLLYRKAERGARRARLCVPASLRPALMHTYHSAPWAGHCGNERMLRRIKELYWWAGMARDVAAHAKACDKCARRKRGNHGRPAPLQDHVIPSRPFETVSTDIVGPLPVSGAPGEYKYIVTMICLATKFMEAVPARTAQAGEVAGIIVNQLVARWGTPAYLITDNGSCYVADMFQEVCKLLGVRQVRCTPLHPASNGALERQHRTLGEALTMYVNAKGTDWPEHLQLVLMAMRSAVNKATGETPYNLVTGFDMVLPYDLITQPGRISYDLDDGPVTRLRRDLPRVFREVRDRMREAARRSKVQYDKGTAAPSFHVGDLVYLRVPVRSKGIGRKFKDRYTGPWRLEERLSPSTWRLRKVYGRKTCVSHCDRLKLARGPDDILSAHARDEAASGSPELGDGVDADVEAGGAGGDNHRAPDGEAEAAPAVNRRGVGVAEPRRSARLGDQLRRQHAVAVSDGDSDSASSDTEWHTEEEDGEEDEQGVGVESNQLGAGAVAETTPTVPRLGVTHPYALRQRRP